MNQPETKTSSESLISERDALKKEIFRAEAIIRENRAKINTIEKQIWRCCVHDWKYIGDEDYYSRIRYQCKKCDLYRNQYMYQ